ncbi:MAG TPA: hypothetical protein VNT26_16120 [Candidatus Sulfotelmatobacter sp.]|nr:hypothetical protein [Candidatus Sulfotelmatobacter sp.]
MCLQKQHVLHRLKFLYDQVHQTAERIEHLPASMPLHIHPQSLNWDEDLHRFEDEYNWLVGQALADKTLTEGELEAEGLPARFPHGWQHG